MKTNLKYLVLKILKTLSESILPMFFWIFIIFGFDAPYMAIITIISAVIHELGHLTAIAFLCPIAKMPRGHISGFRIKTQGVTSYNNNCIILAMGPIFNLIVFALTLPFKNCLDGYLQVFGIINLATAISNLLPVEGYDGYGILTELFMSKNLPMAIRRLEKASFIFSVCATFFSLYVIDKFGNGYWIFGIFFVIMISKLRKSEKHDIYQE